MNSFIRFFIIRGSFFLITGIILFIGIMVPEVKSQMDLPFDFFNGKWVNGHYYEGFIENSSNKNYASNFRYSFTKNKLRFEMSDFPKYIFYWDGDTSATPIISGSYKVKDNFQINIERMRYYKIPESFFHSDQNYKDNYTKTFYVNLNSVWFKNSSSKISESNLSYLYFNDIWIEKNNFVLRTDLDFSIINSTRKQANFISDSNSLDPSPSHSDYFSNKIVLGLLNKFHFSPLDKFNIKLNLGLNYNREKTDSYNVTLESLKQEFSNSIRKNLHISNEVALVSNIISPAYVKIDVDQRFWKTWDENQSVRSFYDGDTIFGSYANETDLMEYRTSYAAELVYISRGAFDKNIIINDYDDYYKHMLFANQVFTSISFVTGKDGDITNVNTRREFLELKAGLGLFNRLDMFLTSSYRYSQQRSGKSQQNNQVLWSTFYNEQLNFNFRFRYRNYEYHEVKDQYWYRFSEYDLVFGTMLEPGHIFLEFNFEPGEYYTRKENIYIDPFSFSKLQHNQKWKLNLYSEIGLGKQISFDYQFIYSRISSEFDIDHFIGFNKRIGNKSKLEFYFYINDYNSYYSPINKWKYRVELSLLL